jgi:hypothetical protein
MRFAQILALAALLAPLTGCHSAYIEATVSNRTAEPLSLVELDYPSASFGTQTLAPGEDFHYRFKVLGSGGTTVLWTDAEHRDHKNSGPALKENDEGSLSVVLRTGGAVWSFAAAAGKSE